MSHILFAHLYEISSTDKPTQINGTETGGCKRLKRKEDGKTCLMGKEFYSGAMGMF